MNFSCGKKNQNQCGTVPRTYGPDMINISKIFSTFKAKKLFFPGLPKANKLPRSICLTNITGKRLETE